MARRPSPGRKQVHSFADLARVEAGEGVASASALPGPEDLDRYERLCNELLARLGVRYPLSLWKVEAWRRKRLLRENYSEIRQYLRQQGMSVPQRTAERAVSEVDRDAKIIMGKMFNGKPDR